MENTKTGYHFGTQLRVGPLGRRLCALRERSRLVSTTIRFDVAIILPPRDGRGWVNQTIELRNDFGNDIIGTCWESLVGGNHLRMWRQSTTNAVFLAYVNRKCLFVFLWALTCVCIVWIVFPRKR